MTALHLPACSESDSVLWAQTPEIALLLHLEGCDMKVFLQECLLLLLTRHEAEKGSTVLVICALLPFNSSLILEAIVIFRRPLSSGKIIPYFYSIVPSNKWKDGSKSWEDNSILNGWNSGLKGIIDTELLFQDFCIFNVTAVCYNMWRSYWQHTQKYQAILAVRFF